MRGELNMKVYIRTMEYPYDYPEDMKLILDYLNSHGQVLVNGYTIEKLYREFSDDQYCAGWMSVDDQMLEEFERWLAKYDM